MLELVARRLREILHARFVLLLLQGERELRVEAAAAREESVRGSATPLAGTKAGRVLEQRRRERVDSVIEDPGPTSS